MKHLITMSLLLLVIASVICAKTTRAQDQSNPTPISSSELVITGPKKNNQQYYYSFTGGPGEVTITLSVKAKAYSTFVGIKVFDAEFNTLTYHNMSADTGSAAMALRKFDIGAKQTLLLSFTSDSNLAECKMTFGGAVEFAGGAEMPAGSNPTDISAAPSTPMIAKSMPQAQVIDQGPLAGGTESMSKNKNFVFSLLDAVGQRFNIPANGKLRVEMKDGSVQEIDLTQVKQILIKK